MIATKLMAAAGVVSMAIAAASGRDAILSHYGPPNMTRTETADPCLYPGRAGCDLIYREAAK